MNLIGDQQEVYDELITLWDRDVVGIVASYIDECERCVTNKQKLIKHSRGEWPYTSANSGGSVLRKHQIIDNIIYLMKFSNDRRGLYDMFAFYKCDLDEFTHYVTHGNDDDSHCGYLLEENTISRTFYNWLNPTNLYRNVANQLRLV